MERQEEEKQQQQQKESNGWNLEQFQSTINTILSSKSYLRI
jgi:hypothetical protein